ncbi:hypothetical protein BS47DRAFT_1362558 [Hydnum rufescens UP504]|uniref:Uncharacterized protein n=1 Tax=Hydnum rufescens UP504 TaxID=1448309 RepID=A0A9P6AWE1_9AGAM|nr:hypothetical protein BS47DRAFT_1362558 [Hydnum rufescens UP504]
MDVCRHPKAQPLNTHDDHHDELNMIPHTHCGGCVLSSIVKPNKAQSEIWVPAQPPKTLTLKYPQLTQRPIKYGATHPLQWVPSLCENLLDEDTDKPPAQNLMHSHPSPEYPAPEQNDQRNLIPHLLQWVTLSPPAQRPARQEHENPHTRYRHIAAEGHNQCNDGQSTVPHPLWWTVPTQKPTW